MNHVVSAMLVIVAIIHLLPLPGVLGRERLGTLYGTSISDPNVVILMRHRAVLFGILGSYFLLSAFRPELQASALVVGFMSASSFLWLARAVGGYNAQVARVVAADVVALLCLVIGAVAYAIQRAA